MKKLVYVFLIGAMISLSGCSKKEEMVDYIPTLTDSLEELAENQDETGEISSEDGQGTSTEEIDTSIRTPMYIELDEFGAFLNVRNAPSREGQVVGSLVHMDKVEVIEIKDGWASILRGNDICYVSADFLVNSQPDPLEAPSTTPVPTAEPTPEPTAKPTKVVTPTPTKEPTKAPKKEEPTTKPNPKKDAEITEAPEPTKAAKPTKAPTTSPQPSKAPVDESQEDELEDDISIDGV